MIERKELAALVEPLNADLAGMIRADMTDIDQVPTPFLVHGAIYRVTHLLPTRPVVFTVGCSGSTAVLLPSAPDAFLHIAQTAGLRLDDDVTRIAYGVTFLETTRSFGERFQILHSVDQIIPRRGLDALQQERFESIVHDYRDVIAPPAISGNDPWVVTVFAAHGQALERITLELDTHGLVQSTAQVLELDLPIPYAR